MNLILGALRSKTLWFNAVIAGAITLIENLTEGLVALGLEPTETALVVAGGNWVLRYLTDQSLEAKAPIR